MTVWTLFQSRPIFSEAGDTLHLILHGGSIKGQDRLPSNPAPIDKWGNGRLVIEISSDQIDQIAPDDLNRIGTAWVHDHGKQVRRLPDMLWDLPSLREFSLTDSRLNTQLFRRGVPDRVHYLSITGSGRLAPCGPPNPQVRLLDTLIRGFHPRLSADMFPQLEGLSVHVGRKSDKKDRREMWDVIRSFENLTMLSVQPADRALDWDALPQGLKRLTVGNGDLNDLSLLHVFGSLNYLNLRYLNSLRTLEGIEVFSDLKTLSMTGMEGLENLSALHRLPNLERVHASRRLAPELFAELEAKGVIIRG